MESGNLVGTVTHHFGKIGVAVVQLSGFLKNGDTIQVRRGKKPLFKQVVDSMQLNHEGILEAGPNNTAGRIGLKVEQRVRSGDEIYIV